MESYLPYLKGVFLNVPFFAFLTFFLGGEAVLQLLRRTLPLGADTYVTLKLFVLLLVLVSLGLWLTGPVRDVLLVNLLRGDDVNTVVKAALVVWTLFVSLLDALEVRRAERELRKR
ncbi:hypothetical protein [Hydrogenivirga sp.]